MGLFRRGAIVTARLGSVQDETFCLIIQNGIGNRVSPVTIVAAVVHAEVVPDLTSPLVVPIGSSILSFPACVLCDQIHTIAKKRLGPEVGSLTQKDMEQVDKRLAESLFAFDSGEPLLVEPEENVAAAHPPVED